MLKHELPGLAHDEVKVFGPGQDRAGGQYDPGSTVCYYSYASEMQKAIEEDGVNVMGYFPRRSRAAA